MYQSQNALMEELNKVKGDLRREWDGAAENRKIIAEQADEIARLKNELRLSREQLAAAEMDRDAWRERYREEANDNFATEFKLEEYAGFYTLDDLISAYHKALDDLYEVRERMTKRIPVRRRKDGAVRRAT